MSKILPYIKLIKTIHLYTSNNRQQKNCIFLQSTLYKGDIFVKKFNKYRWFNDFHSTIFSILVIYTQSKCCKYFETKLEKLNWNEMTDKYLTFLQKKDFSSLYETINFKTILKFPPTLISIHSATPQYDTVKFYCFYYVVRRRFNLFTEHMNMSSHRLNHLYTPLTYCQLISNSLIMTTCAQVNVQNILEA